MLQHTQHEQPSPGCLFWQLTVRRFIFGANRGKRRGLAGAGGHSLGGAFALLMLCMARVRMEYDPNTIRCYAFGAPPVLSLSEKTSAQNVMSVCCSLCQLSSLLVLRERVETLVVV